MSQRAIALGRTFVAGRGAWRALLLALALGLPALPAQALCFQPLCTCSVSVTPLNFDAVNPLQSQPTDVSGRLRLSCGGIAGLLIPYRVDLGPGEGGSTSDRRLTGPGGRTLAYNLYQDSSRNVHWGEGLTHGLGGGMLLDLLGLAPDHLLPIYGRIPGRQIGAVPGEYRDTVMLTVTFN